VAGTDSLIIGFENETVRKESERESRTVRSLTVIPISVVSVS
jgi:hypothetical protein